MFGSLCACAVLDPGPTLVNAALHVAQCDSAGLGAGSVLDLAVTAQGPHHASRRMRCHIQRNRSEKALYHLRENDYSY